MLNIVTGGAGFIGRELVRQLLEIEGEHVWVLDSLTYASRRSNLNFTQKEFKFFKIDITNTEEVKKLFDVALEEFNNLNIRVFHLAAESHVDRSINSGKEFVLTNVLGTQILLENSTRIEVARFLHVSTDEVYGPIPRGEALESFPLLPTSAYAASKAASDLLVLAQHKTHGLDVVITRCVNNYGELQLPEKFIPRMVNKALRGDPLPIYGDGLQEREWIYVRDHVRALLVVMKLGESGSIYNIGTGERVKNLELAQLILKTLQSESKIEFIVDRKGHDRRYAVNSNKILGELGWKSETDHKNGIREAIIEISKLAKEMNSQETFGETEKLYE